MAEFTAYRVPTKSTDLDLSGTSALPEMGVVPSAVQASDNSIQFSVLCPLYSPITIPYSAVCVYVYVFLCYWGAVK